MEQNEAVVERKTSSPSLGFNGIWQVFVSPSNFFAKLKDDPKILVPMIILVILTGCLMYGLSDLIVQMQMDSPELQERLQGQELPEQAKEIMRYTSIGVGSFVLLLFALLAALMVKLFSGTATTNKIPYSKILSITLYGAILYCIGNLALMPLVLAKGSLMTSLSLGVLVVDQGMESVAYVALSKIGLFYIWEMIVVGIGLSVFYDMPRNKGYVLSVISLGSLYLIQVLITLVKTMT